MYNVNRAFYDVRGRYSLQTICCLTYCFNVHKQEIKDLKYNQLKMSMTKRQRWALPTDFLYSDSYRTKKIFSKYLTNIGLQISEQKQSTSDSPIAIRVTEIYWIKMGNFHSFCVFLHDFFANFRENS
jgi:hypothetical protein